MCLHEDQAFIKIIKDSDNYSLSIKNDKVTSSISKIGNPNRELLSDSSHLDSEENNIMLSS
ncbi:hypothetical protein [Wolbachia endosymbiont of Dirofilaria (Dirofilaria) immitis]|uniref:hypothetical protein n=1 Tax=Wolbachia endosymbiont of Dirofilaria (Dirofilaria) immitis TaxID=1812115 RepID=UPI00158B8C8E|nr:hypothetical protein [Wolbachia endosymbiont of Dirofilaria (Dirofilaria) immitis]QKX02587.1 hypothetical protein GOY12_03535 [Wolbachia endosymbiont of Dirofilaria (Dirofilaria) immitis]